jgi:hypothetical protein
MTFDPWRARCPEGHTSIRRHTGGQSHYCTVCRQTYDEPPTDAKTGTVGVDR